MFDRYRQISANVTVMFAQPTPRQKMPSRQENAISDY